MGIEPLTLAAWTPCSTTGVINYDPCHVNDLWPARGGGVRDRNPPRTYNWRGGGGAARDCNPPPTYDWRGGTSRGVTNRRYITSWDENGLAIPKFRIIWGARWKSVAASWRWLLYKVELELDHDRLWYLNRTESISWLRLGETNLGKAKSPPAL